MRDDFEALIAEAEAAPFSGWDFSWLWGRVRYENPRWSYEERVRRKLRASGPLLDLGTGGGEFLASLVPLPAGSAATEAYPPNVPIARQRLEPLGVQVVEVQGAPDNVDIGPGEGIGTLPFPDERFPLIINRHESYYASEVYRILQTGGTYLTQQVGGDHHRELSELLGAPRGYGADWNLDFAVRQLEEAGFHIVEALEDHPATIFSDVGAVVYYLEAIPWEVPDFTVEAYLQPLIAIHERIRQEGPLPIPGHFMYIEAVRG